MKNMIIAGLISAAFAAFIIIAVNYWPDSPAYTGTVLFVVGIGLAHVLRKTS